MHAAEHLIGRRLSQELIQEVVTNGMEEISPPDDFRGSAEYRRAMAGVMTRRVLEACLEGASQL
jgi:carbon-monoxide dehydrogenase medium subunit